MSMRYDNPLYAFIGSLEAGADHSLSPPGKAPTVTVSRAMGSGGDLIARRLAERLRMHCYDKEILEQVAKRASASPHIVKRLYESDADPTEAGIYAMISGKPLTEENYLNYLAMVMQWAHREGGVIVGRAGHLVLTDPDILRIRVTATEKSCAAHVAAEETLDPDVALRKVRKSRKARETFMDRHFGSTYKDPELFDIVVRTDHFENLDQVVELLLSAFRAKGGVFADWMSAKAI